MEPLSNRIDRDSNLPEFHQAAQAQHQPAVIPNSASRQQNARNPSSFTQELDTEQYNYSTEPQPPQHSANEKDRHRIPFDWSPLVFGIAIALTTAIIVGAAVGGGVGGALSDSDAYAKLHYSLRHHCWLKRSQRQANIQQSLRRSRHHRTIITINDDNTNIPNNSSRYLYPHSQLLPLTLHLNLKPIPPLPCIKFPTLQISLVRPTLPSTLRLSLHRRRYRLRLRLQLAGLHRRLCFHQRLRCEEQSIRRKHHLRTRRVPGQCGRQRIATASKLLVERCWCCGWDH